MIVVYGPKWRPKQACRKWMPEAVKGTKYYLRLRRYVEREQKLCILAEKGALTQGELDELGSSGEHEVLVFLMDGKKNPLVVQVGHLQVMHSSWDTISEHKAFQLYCITSFGRTIAPEKHEPTPQELYPVFSRTTAGMFHFSMHGRC